MAQMATVPVFKCRRCGTPVYVTYLASQGSDPDAAKLKELMNGLADIALCGHCQAVYNYLAARGRSDEFLINPQPVILTIEDTSGLDYYKG